MNQEFDPCFNCGSLDHWVQDCGYAKMYNHDFRRYNGDYQVMEALNDIAASVQKVVQKLERQMVINATVQQQLSQLAEQIYQVNEPEYSDVELEAVSNMEKVAEVEAESEEDMGFDDFSDPFEVYWMPTNYACPCEESCLEEMPVKMVVMTAEPVRKMTAGKTEHSFVSIKYNDNILQESSSEEDKRMAIIQNLLYSRVNCFLLRKHEILMLSYPVNYRAYKGNVMGKCGLKPP